MGRAYAVAVRDGGEPLDVRTEKPDEHLRLGLAQLREIRCDMGDRAVVLADLDAGAGLLCGRGVAIGGERRSQLSRTPISGDLHQRSGVASLQAVQALPREGAHGGVAAGVPQVVEGLDRDVVVGVRETASGRRRSGRIASPDGRGLGAAREPCAREPRRLRRRQ